MNHNANTLPSEIPIANVIDLESMRRHRQLARAREWLQAQLPWERADARAISERIRAA